MGWAESNAAAQMGRMDNTNRLFMVRFLFIIWYGLKTMIGNVLLKVLKVNPNP
jgi:hypothetical protein